MSKQSDLAAFSSGVRQARSAMASFVRAVSTAGSVLNAPRSLAACAGGTCAQQAAPRSPSVGGASGSSQIGSQLGRELGSALRGSLSQALQSVAQSFARLLGSQLSRSIGGLGGGLLGGLVQGGLSALLGGLFRKRQRVQVDNTVRAEVLNFPRLSSLDFAANPASRLFSGRAVPRGPAFVVEVNYRGGTDEIITAKVAQKLSELNMLQGVR